jgi:CyaY protein
MRNSKRIKTLKRRLKWAWWRINRHDRANWNLAGATLAALEARLRGAPAPTQPGHRVLEVEFEDGSKMIINRHGAAREIWVAAKSGGFHFRHDGSAWRDTRDGTELFAAVSKLASLQSGTPIVLTC